MICNKLALYDEEKKVYHISNKIIAFGNEGKVHLVETYPAYVAKIFNNPNTVKHEKLSAMLDVNFDNTLYDCLTLPIHILYDKENNFKGYLMKRVNNAITLYDFLHNNSTFEKRLQIAEKICENVYKLHENNIVFGDFTPQNILIAENYKVLFIDSDSIQFEGKKVYRCKFGKLEFLPVEIQQRIDYEKKCPVSNKLFFSKQTDLFALAIIIFLLIVCNKHPYLCEYRSIIFKLFIKLPTPSRNIAVGYFPLFQKNILYKAPKETIAFYKLNKDVQKLFIDTFHTYYNIPKKRIDALAWLNIIHKLQKEINCQ